MPASELEVQPVSIYSLAGRQTPGPTRSLSTFMFLEQDIDTIFDPVIEGILELVIDEILEAREVDVCSLPRAVLGPV